jgi:hypothetical protein
MIPIVALIHFVTSGTILQVERSETSQTVMDGESSKLLIIPEMHWIKVF